MRAFAQAHYITANTGLIMIHDLINAAMQHQDDLVLSMDYVDAQGKKDFTYRKPDPFHVAKSISGPMPVPVRTPAIRHPTLQQFYPAERRELCHAGSHVLGRKREPLGTKPRNFQVGIELLDN